MNKRLESWFSRRRTVKCEGSRSGVPVFSILFLVSVVETFIYRSQTRFRRPHSIQLNTKAKRAGSESTELTQPAQNHLANDDQIHEMTSAPLSPKEEKEKIKELLAVKMKEGQEWCVIDFKWYFMWQQYVDFEGEGEGDGQRPGPMDNSSLLEGLVFR